MNYIKIYGQKLIVSIIMLLVCIKCFFCNTTENTTEEKIIGIKIYSHNGDYEKLFKEWNSLGINTVFVVSEALYGQDTFRELAKEYGVKLFITAQTFMNAEALEKDSSLYAITDKGEKAIEEWAEFVCPTRENYRKERIEHFKEIVRKYKPDGFSLDFIRYFVFWENVYPDTKADDLPNTCFCAHCLEKFQEDKSIEIPDSLEKVSEIADWIINNHNEEFTNWKCDNITSMVKDMVNAVIEVDPEIIINLHAIPWKQDDYDGAIKKNVGQDFKALAEYTDYISPMCYSNLLKREPSWISSITNDIAEYSQKNVIQSIQIKEINTEKEEPYSPEDFEKCLKEALKEPSKGVLLFVWDWNSLDGEDERKEILKETVKKLN